MLTKALSLGIISVNSDSILFKVILSHSFQLLVSTFHFSGHLLCTVKLRSPAVRNITACRTLILVKKERGEKHALIGETHGICNIHTHKALKIRAGLYI